MGQQHVLHMETLQRTAVGTASDQHGSAACSVYGDLTVCSCRHSKTSARVSGRYCVWRPYSVQL